MDRSEVEAIFAPLASKRQEEFLDKVAPDVDWTVMGTHPLAGHYRSRDEFAAATIGRINPRLQELPILTVTHVVVEGNEAAVELVATGTQKNDRPFIATYCWVCTIEGGVIVNNRAYVDSALVQQVIDTNEGP